MRTNRWRYARWPDGGEELYDLTNDGREWKNLAESDAHRGTLSAMRTHLKRCEAQAVTLRK